LLHELSDTLVEGKNINQKAVNHQSIDHLPSLQKSICVYVEAKVPNLRLSPDFLHQNYMYT